MVDGQFFACFFYFTRFELRFGNIPCYACPFPASHLGSLRSIGRIEESEKKKQKMWQVRKWYERKSDLKRKHAKNMPWMDIPSNNIWINAPSTLKRRTWKTHLAARSSWRFRHPQLIEDARSRDLAFKIPPIPSTPSLWPYKCLYTYTYTWPKTLPKGQRVLCDNNDFRWSYFNLQFLRIRNMWSGSNLIGIGT